MDLVLYVHQGPIASSYASDCSCFTLLGLYSNQEMSGKENSVAIIGGVISGLVCAARLSQLGLTNAVVFDTGKQAPGGRCSSRFISINGKLHIFDHAVHFFTVSGQNRILFA